MIKPTSQCNDNNLTRSSTTEPFSVREKKITREQTKTGHNATVIKPTLQQHNNPQLDPRCLSSLEKFLQRDENKMTSINMKVSNLIHNQRTVLTSKHYKIGSFTQPIDDLNKISKLSIYTQISSQLSWVWSHNYIQSISSEQSSVRLCMYPSIRREFRLVWVYRKIWP